MMGRDSPVKTAKERGPPPLPKLGKGMAPLAIPIDVRMRVDKTLASERFDFSDIVEMVYRPSGIHSDLEHEAAGAGRPSPPKFFSKTKGSLSSPFGRSQDFQRPPTRGTILDPFGVVAMVQALDLPQTMSGPDPMKQKAQSKAVEALQGLVRAQRGNRQMLEGIKYIRAAGLNRVMDEGEQEGKQEGEVATYQMALVRGLESGNDTTRSVCATLLRSCLRDVSEKDETINMMWRRSKKSKVSECLAALQSMLRSKVQATQEDALRLMAAMGRDADSLIAIGKRSKMQECLLDSLLVGTDKAKESSVWLMWRMTQDSQCSRTLGNVEDSLGKLCSGLSERMKQAYIEENTKRKDRGVSTAEGTRPADSGNVKFPLATFESMTLEQQSESVRLSRSRSVAAVDLKTEKVVDVDSGFARSSSFAASPRRTNEVANGRTSPTTNLSPSSRSPRRSRSKELSPARTESPEKLEASIVWGNLQENILATIANIASHEDYTERVGRNACVIRVAMEALKHGSERARENAALLVGNISCNDEICKSLDGIPFDDMVGCMLIGSDRAREYVSLAFANLSRMVKHAEKILGAEGSRDVLMAVRAGAKSKRARQAAERALSNIGRTRMSKAKWKRSPKEVQTPYAPDKALSLSLREHSKRLRAEGDLPDSIVNSPAHGQSPARELLKSRTMTELETSQSPSAWDQHRSQVAVNFPSIVRAQNNRTVKSFFATASLPFTEREGGDPPGYERALSLSVARTAPFTPGEGKRRGESRGAPFSSGQASPQGRTRKAGSRQQSRGSAGGNPMSPNHLKSPLEPRSPAGA